MRLEPEPAQLPDGRFEVWAVVRHSAREVTQDEFVCDLITLASGVQASYEGWTLLAGDPAAEMSTQPPMPSLLQ